MKRLTLALLALSLAVLGGCSVAEPERSSVISFKIETGLLAKGAEYTSETLPAGHRMFIAATHKDTLGHVINGNYLGKTTVSDSYYALESGVGFYTKGSNSAVFKSAAAPFSEVDIYYPINGRIDFLVCTTPAVVDLTNADGWLSKVKFDNIDDSASSLTVEDLDTDLIQEDFVWAYSNGNHYGRDRGQVSLEFRHAQALLGFNLVVPAGNKVVVDDIVFWTDDYVESLDARVADEGDPLTVPYAAPSLVRHINLKTKGSFNVWNGDIEIESYWSNLVASLSGARGSMRAHDPAGSAPFSASEANDETGLEAAAIRYGATPLHQAAQRIIQVGETVLIPEQHSLDFILYYHYEEAGETPEAPYKRHIHVKTLRRMWNMGRTYIYNLDLSDLQ